MSSTNKIKILFIIDGLFQGGKERQLIEILKGLDKNKFATGIVTFNKAQFYTETAKSLVDYFLVLDKNRSKLMPFLSIWKGFAQFRPDIIHTWDYLSSFYAYLPCRLNRSVFINGSIRDAGIERGWQRALKYFFLKRANLAIANSRAGLKAYGLKGEVVYNAINVGRFKKLSKNSGFNIIMVANFSDYKDYDTFIVAAIELVKNRIVDNVYMAGDGVHRKRIEGIVNRADIDLSGKIHFLGPVGNIEDYLCMCQVGVLCSTLQFSEGISNSVLEYIAAGLIPVATDIGATNEIIDDGENGFLIKPADHSAIVRIIKDIKENKIDVLKIKNRGAETISGKFSYSNNIKMLENIYSTMAK